MKQPATFTASYYKSKAKASFRTKLNLFLYNHVVWSRREFSLQAFQEFEIKPDLVHEYTTIYWQMDYDLVKINGLLIRTIYDQMKELRKKYATDITAWQADYVANTFQKLFPIEQFIEKTSAEFCAYCKATVDDIKKLAQAELLFKKHERGWTLELDRRNSNFEYTPDNCVMACYWCNNAKTDEFTAEEFEIIAKGIRKVWDQRLSRANQGVVNKTTAERQDGS